MESVGIVRSWYSDEGWGVIDTEQTPGGCWAHFSNLAMPGYRSLKTGDAVNLEWEAADQDGFSFRATRLWPVGTQPTQDASPDKPGNAYGSTLTISIDNE